MQIGAICKRQVVSVDALSTLGEAARLMRQHHVGALVVTSAGDEGRRVCGIVTDRDLVLDALARDAKGEELQVGELAHATLVLVSEHAHLDEALLAMEHSGVRRLLVKDGDDQLIGLLSLDDLIEAYAAEFDKLARIIRSGLAREARETVAIPDPSAPALRIPAIGRAAWASVVV